MQRVITKPPHAYVSRAPTTTANLCHIFHHVSSDLKYYSLLRAWNKSDNHDLTFSNSHEKAYQVRDSSTQATLKARLLERMKNSKNMLLIISDDTNYDRGLLNFEIEKAVDYYELPLIIAYPEYRSILNPSSHPQIGLMRMLTSK
ncbi:TIR domain-containing protein [Paenibacillus mendelii]|uniref:TIR domain-containing protein n=1 Tax=Paenibacillus mendelii TaxID=206163 RepID=A0ABV6JFQ0_9BACL|nr:TIR domain-containing protein [Paenibacillus mendelii]